LEVEGPQHLVTFARSFRLAQHCVTNAQFARFLLSRHPERNQDRCPVVDVDWFEAVMFCRWLGVRLPSEAEWEYACRAGTTTAFSFGENITPQEVNYDGNYPYANAAKGEYRKRTVPVGSLSANAWGLHEMHGNVWEWCQDWRGGYETAPADGSANEVEGSGDRVLRGGSWFAGAGGCRSACRDGGRPGFRGGGVGFRPASSSPVCFTTSPPDPSDPT
jgi:formylglycine-generating enzyme required for sulfatase activity